MRQVLAVLAAVVLLGGCAGVTEAEPEPTSAAPLPSPSVRPGGRSLTGTLGGDENLEGGCAWLDTAGGRYEVLYPEGYEIRFDPLRLEGPAGTVAAAGERLRVEGAPATDLASICQVGDLFRATAVSAL